MERNAGKAAKSDIFARMPHEERLIAFAQKNQDARERVETNRAKKLTYRPSSLTCTPSRHCSTVLVSSIFFISRLT